jgi:hypothetical protein
VVDTDIFVALQIEWCKAWARVQRWEEEVRRAGVSLEYRAREWEERTRTVPVGADEWNE